ncbi:MAG: DUF4013 domain-containing protein [Chloroflexi bacterium]|nr:DUF4013 domain-containing protein [Chloroflexota bacterium]
MTTSTVEGIQHLFTYPFKDADWKQKLLIASLLALVGMVIPILVPMIFLTGYCERIIRRIVREDGEPYLPEWDDWNDLFVKGIKLFGVGFVYSLPSLVLLAGGYTLMMAPVLVIELVESRIGEWVFVAGMMGGMGIMGMAMFIGLVTGIIAPVAMIHVAAKDDFSAAFRVGEWWPILRANLPGFILSYVIMMGVWFATTFVAQFLYLTIILCCLVPFVFSILTAYVMLVSSALFACTYRDGVANLSDQDSEVDDRV